MFARRANINTIKAYTLPDNVQPFNKLATYSLYNKFHTIITSFTEICSQTVKKAYGKPRKTCGCQRTLRQLHGPSRLTPDSTIVPIRHGSTPQL